VSLSYTRRTHDLPNPIELYGRARALALVELAINDRPLLRVHTLDPAIDQHVRVSSGSGDEASVWLPSPGCVVRGFDHESELSPWMADERRIWPGLFDGLPPEFADGPRLNIHDGVEDLTFLLWWRGDGPWQTGTLPPEVPGQGDLDGSHVLLSPLASDVGGLGFLNEVYETDMPTDILGRFPNEGTVDWDALSDLPNLRPPDVVAMDLASLGIDLNRPS